MLLSSDYVRDADKFFGNLNSVLQWNSARGKSREFLLKCFERGFNFGRQFVGLHRPNMKQIRYCKTLLKSGVSAGGQGFYCFRKLCIGSSVAHGVSY